MLIPEKAIVVWKLRDGSDFHAFITFWPGERKDMDRGDRYKNYRRKVERFLRSCKMDRKYYPATAESIEVVAFKDWESGDW